MTSLFSLTKNRKRTTSFCSAICDAYFLSVSSFCDRGTLYHMYLIYMYVSGTTFAIMYFTGHFCRNRNQNEPSGDVLRLSFLMSSYTKRTNNKTRTTSYAYVSCFTCIIYPWSKIVALVCSFPPKGLATFPSLRVICATYLSYHVRVLHYLDFWLARQEFCQPSPLPTQPTHHPPIHPTAPTPPGARASMVAVFLLSHYIIPVYCCTWYKW